jgi:Kdo2-lipid IVA lauroyltransferase/acyltransferase
MIGSKLRYLALTRDTVDWLRAKTVFALLWMLRLLPPDFALGVLSWCARRIGPFLKRNTETMNNLARALPELSNEEHKKIASEMWENMARLVGEYLFLDDFFDSDPRNPEIDRLEIHGADLFDQLVANGRPKIFFTGHLGNFELLPMAAAMFGLHITAMFRPPNNKYIAERIMSERKTRMGHLVPSKAGASITLARILEAGGNVGVLVDQKFINGLDTTFFGVPCLTSPLLAKLTRQFDCDVYPAVCVRLPNGRFRLTLEEKFPIPRDDKGRVDQLALMQAINNHVEGWIRADPGQWMWFHNRWQIRKTKKRLAL